MCVETVTHTWTHGLHTMDLTLVGIKGEIYCMKNFIETIKRTALQAVDASKPVEICYGTVQSIEPFQIRLSQKLILGKEFFLVRSGMTKNSFETGDLLILFRLQGGQQYLIFDRKGAL